MVGLVRDGFVQAVLRCRQCLARALRPWCCGERSPGRRRTQPLAWTGCAAGGVLQVGGSIPPRCQHEGFAALAVAYERCSGLAAPTVPATTTRWAAMTVAGVARPLTTYVVFRSAGATCRCEAHRADDDRVHGAQCRGGLGCESPRHMTTSCEDRHLDLRPVRVLLEVVTELAGQRVATGMAARSWSSCWRMRSRTGAGNCCRPVWSRCARSVPTLAAALAAHAPTWTWQLPPGGLSLGGPGWARRLRGRGAGVGLGSAGGGRRLFRRRPRPL